VCNTCTTSSTTKGHDSLLLRLPSDPIALSTHIDHRGPTIHLPRTNLRSFFSFDRTAAPTSLEPAYPFHKPRPPASGLHRHTRLRQLRLLLHALTIPHLIQLPPVGLCPLWLLHPLPPTHPPITDDGLRPHKLNSLLILHCPRIPREQARTRPHLV
jgi:hypothetical protein